MSLCYSCEVGPEWMRQMLWWESERGVPFEPYTCWLVMRPVMRPDCKYPCYGRSELAGVITIG